jgi:hypothetical protein
MNPIMSNPWTSSTGALALIGAVFGIIHAVSTGTAPDSAELQMIFFGIVSGIGLIKAKDWNVTGGSIPQTKEAETRAESPPLK